jgi:hypothetical protein
VVLVEYLRIVDREAAVKRVDESLAEAFAELWGMQLNEAPGRLRHLLR